jgi:hypothetical protein
MSKQQKKQSRKTRRQRRSRKIRGGNLFENPAPKVAPSAQEPVQEQPVAPVQGQSSDSKQDKPWWKFWGGKKSRKQTRK